MLKFFILIGALGTEEVKLKEFSPVGACVSASAAYFI
jgi:hypothetical protein